MTVRDALWLMIDSDPFREFELDHPTDAAKIRAEWAGMRRPLPRSRYALGLVTLIRKHPAPIVPPDPPPPVPMVVPQPFAFARHPAGGIEDIAAYARAGGKGLLLNLEHPPSRWQTIRDRCDAAGIWWSYWQHCRDQATLDRLLSTSVGRPFVGINVEEELQTTLSPGVVAARYRASGIAARPLLIAYGWVQNNVRFTQADTARWTLALEMFPADAPDLAPPVEKWPLCVQHARQLGHTGPVVQLAQCYAAGKPSWYDEPYSLYTLDDAQRLGVDAWL